MSTTATVPLIRQRDAARLLDCSTRYLRKLMDAGYLRFARVPVPSSKPDSTERQIPEDELRRLAVEMKRTLPEDLTARTRGPEDRGPRTEDRLVPILRPPSEADDSRDVSVLKHEVRPPWHAEEYRAKLAAGEAVTPVRKTAPFEVKLEDAAAGKPRRATFVISTEDVDRSRDIVKLSGWDTANWEKHPVVLLGHNYRDIPVARGVSVEKADGKLRATIEWPPAGELAESDRSYTAVKNGLLAASVGFRPKVSAWNEERRGMDFLEQELLEFSLVAVPDNPAALLETVKSAAPEDLERAVEAMVVKTLAAIEVKGSVPSNVSTSKAPEDQAWSAPSLSDFTDKSWDDLSDDEKRKIAGHYAWAAALPPTKFGDLKLPHHDPKTGSVVWRGVAAAMAALKGGRGGVVIPAGDKGKVYAHLAAHYKQFDKEPPAKAAVDVVAKEGRVLSAANVALLKQALGHCEALQGHHESAAKAVGDCVKCLKGLLDQAPEDDEDPDESDETQDEGVDDADESESAGKAAAPEAVSLDLAALLKQVETACARAVEEHVSAAVNKLTGRID